MSDVAADPRIVSDYPALSESLWRAASQQLRNMATVGGNLLQRTRCAYFRFGDPFPCNKRKPGSGCAAIGGIDCGHALLGGSEACIAVYPSDWAIAFAAFDAKIDVLGPNGERTIALEHLHREPGTTPHIETTLEPSELILRAAHIAIGGLATRPWRVPAAEQALAGKTLTQQAAREAGNIALQGAKPGHDNAFRIELGARTVAAALMIAKQRA
jgi:xanthine dehydrogenase YagS FAD-binding subunit